MLTDPVSSNSPVLALFRKLLPLSPLLKHQPTAARVPLGADRGRDDPVGAEMAVVLAHLAPRRDHPHSLEISDGERPDGPAALAALEIDIGDREPALPADRVADDGE